MTHEETCKEYNIDDIGDFSDGYHTFNELYYQRLILFATIVNCNKDISWKTKRHEDGELCFNGNWFLVTIDTPRGSYGYHYENKYWELFDCKELDKAKPWDGYTDKDVTRLLSLINVDKEVEPVNIILNDGYIEYWNCPTCGIQHFGFDEYGKQNIESYCNCCGQKLNWNRIMDSILNQ